MKKSIAVIMILAICVLAAGCGRSNKAEKEQEAVQTIAAAEKIVVGFSQLGADSLDIAEIILRIEEEFGIELSNEEVGKTIGSLVTYINTNLGSDLI